jgi:amino acid transporter
MKRTISPLGLLLTSISAVVGSGWLFSTYYTARLSGPASLLAWIIGGVFIIIVALVFSEICAMIPVSGSSVRIPQYTHGSVVSFLFAWMIWLSYLALMSTETQAVIQYASFYFPTLTGEAGKLTGYGYLAAAAIMLLVSTINVYSIRWLIRFNSFLTYIKIIIPIIIIAVIFYLYLEPSKVFHPAHSNFMPLGFHGVFGALSMGGILFAFNGFKQAAEMAGEAEKPHISVPFALIGSIIFCMVFYLLLQLAFNSTILPSNIIHGWENLTLSNDSSPFAAILEQSNLTSLLPVLYIGAIIAPFAAGLMYCSSAGRSLFGMSKNGYLPKFIQKLSPQGNPTYAIWMNFLYGMCLFAPLPGWDKMMSFLTSLLAITYAVGPICLLTLRYQLPKQKRPLKLPFGALWSMIALYICTLLAYFTGWDILSKMSIAVGLGFAVLLIQHFLTKKSKRTKLNWREAVWLWPYLIGLTIISKIGNYGNGLDIFFSTTDYILIAVLCVFCMFLAVKLRLPSEITQGYIDKLHLDKEDHIA